VEGKDNEVTTSEMNGGRLGSSADMVLVGRYDAAFAEK
jgi:hypothetical protein